jgi:hypothetical protein
MRHYRMKKIGSAVLLSVTLLACKKEHHDAVPVHAAITLNIHQYQSSNSIPPTFLGLSFETAILTRNPEYLNGNNSSLIQLIKNLGPGILRIGGDSSDQIAWTGKPRNDKSSADSLTTSDVDRLSAFSMATGWKVLYGLNMGSNDAAAAADEARYVHNVLGNNLYALQFGNEPDVYMKNSIRTAGYQIKDYVNDWDSYYSAVNVSIPGVALAGPDISNKGDWLSGFAFTRHDKIKMLDAHYYVTGPAWSPSITYYNLLYKDYYLSRYLGDIKASASAYGLPFRITECNSIYGGGKAGTSDVFASALWALDFMWIVAENGGQGVNFHDGQGLVYSPATMSNGALVIHPEYYAMLAFKYGNKGGKIVPIDFSDNQSQYNCSAYACLNADGTWSVTIINKDITDIAFTLQLTKATASIEILRLTAPSVTAASGVEFAGSTVSSDGSFKPSNTEHLAANKDNCAVNVPAGSAAVVVVH